MRKLGQTRLFYGFTPLEIRTLCQALCAKTVVYEPGDRIFQQDELPEYAALILEGDVWCIRYDDEGNACPLFLLEEGDLACSLSLFCTTPFPYTACARKKTTVLMMNMYCLLPPEFPSLFTIRQRLLSYSTTRQRILIETLQMLSLPTLRQRILFLLCCQRKCRENKWFSLPYSREEMAAVLRCNRSALSKELGKMEAEGIIEYKGSHFLLHTRQEGREE